MVPNVKVREVERLLILGHYSQRKIALMVGLSRAVIRSIASGSRPDYEARRAARQAEQHEVLGPLGRCPHCGGRVYLPCRLCKVRSLKEAQRAALRAQRRQQAHAPFHSPSKLVGAAAGASDRWPAGRT